MSIELIKIPAFAYPFKPTSGSTANGSSLSKKHFDALTNSHSGYYPFSPLGMWHGGIHYTDGGLGEFDQKEGVLAIADGDLVAYRLNNEPIIDEYDNPYSSSFLLYRHVLEYPVGNKLTLFSLYMHTATEQEYINTSTHETTRATNIRADFSDTATLLYKANKGTQYSLAELKNNRYRILSKNGIPVTGTETVHQSYVKSLSGNAVLPQDIQINQVAQFPTKYTTKAGKMIGFMGDYTTPEKPERKLLHLEIFTGDDILLFISNATQAYIDHKAYPYYSDTNIGKQLENTKKPPEDNLLYVEENEQLFHIQEITVKTPSGSNVNVRPAFANGGTEAFSYPKGTLFELGTQIDPATDRTNITSINGVETDRLLTVGNPYVMDMKSWKATKMNGATGKAQINIVLPLSETTKIKDIEGKEWFKFRAPLPGGGHVDAAVPIQNTLHGIIFPGFKVVDNPSTDQTTILVNGKAYLKGVFNPELGVEAEYEKLDASFKEIYQEIDTDKDGQLEKSELDAAMRNPLVREQLANYIIKHPSEWKWDAAKWNTLDEIIPDDEDNQKDWANEKKRIEKLCWWDEVAALGIEGFPKDHNVYHIHPVALVRALHVNSCECCIKETHFFNAYTKETGVELTGVQQDAITHIFSGVEKFYDDHKE